MKTSFTLTLRRQSSPFCSFVSIKTFVEQSHEFLFCSPDKIFHGASRELRANNSDRFCGASDLFFVFRKAARNSARNENFDKASTLSHQRVFTSTRGNKKFITRKAFSQPQRLFALLFSCRKL